MDRRRLRDAHNWQSQTRIKESSPKILTLCRSLEEIAEQSQSLLVKGKLARLLDKTQDSQEVGRLVERLRQAILIYQVCYAQSLPNRANAFGTGIPTTVNKQPSRTVGSKLPSIHFAVLADGQPSKSSLNVLLGLHGVRRQTDIPT